MQEISLKLMKIAMDIGGVEEIMKYVFSSGFRKSYKTLRDILSLEGLLKEIPSFGKKLQARAAERGLKETKPFLIIFADILSKTIERLVLGNSEDQERFKIYLDYILDQNDYKPFIRYIVSAENAENYDFSDKDL